jgi:hypothetical protein
VCEVLVFPLQIHPADQNYERLQCELEAVDDDSEEAEMVRRLFSGSSSSSSPCGAERQILWELMSVDML